MIFTFRRANDSWSSGASVIRSRSAKARSRIEGRIESHSRPQATRNLHTSNARERAVRLLAALADPQLGDA